MLRRHLILPLLVPVLALAEESAPEAVPESAAAVLDRYVEVTGGREAHLRWASRISRGTQSMSSLDAVTLLSVYETDTTCRLVVSRSEVMGEVRAGSRSSFAWNDSIAAGPRLLKGVELAYALRTAPIDAAANWREHFVKLVDLGREDLDGTACRVVEVHPKEGKPERRHYSAASGLLLRAELEVFLDGNPVRGSISYEDYREIDGLLLPHTVIERQAGLEVVTNRIERIDHHTPIDPAVFEPPEGVRALLER